MLFMFQHLSGIVIIPHYTMELINNNSSLNEYIVVVITGTFTNFFHFTSLVICDDVKSYFIIKNNTNYWSMFVSNHNIKNNSKITFYNF